MEQIDLNVSEKALRATLYARATLEAGFTTVRDLCSRFVGSKEFVDVALRNSINKGVSGGPRMLVATYGIGATGGDFDPTSGFRDMLFGHEPDFSQGIADGPDAIRKAVRFEVKNGADVIKAAVSGGVLSLADEVTRRNSRRQKWQPWLMNHIVCAKKWPFIVMAIRRRRKRSRPASIRSSTARS